ncbi:MAG: type II secretion system protein [Patescibacteria group bacterium]
MKGALLLELLVVIGVFAILVPLVAQIIIASLSVNKVSVENTAALALMDEVITATDSISFTHWHDIYNLTKNISNHYYPVKAAGAWSLASGDEIINVNGINYTRYFTVSNVCRDASNNIINDNNFPPCVGGNGDDPSVQRIIINVSWNNRSISKNTYVTRWRNQVCYQTSWTEIGAGPLTCPTTLYDSATSIDINTTPGSLKIQAN